MTRVLAVCGQMGAGKTTLLDELNELLGWDRLSIDAERAAGRDWAELSARVRRLTKPAIVESVVLPAVYRTALKAQDTTIMLVTCDEDERKRRVAAAGEHRPSDRLNYSRSMTHFRVDTTHGVDSELLTRIADMARTRYARRPTGGTTMHEEHDALPRPDESEEHLAADGQRGPGGNMARTIRGDEAGDYAIVRQGADRVVLPAAA